MRSRSRREWVSGEEEVLPAMSTTSAAFASILDGLVREVDGPEAAGVVAAAIGAAADAAAAGTGGAADAAGPGHAAGIPAARGASSRSSGADDGGDARLDEGFARGSGDGPGEASGVAATGAAAGPPPPRLRGRGDLTLVVGLGAETIAAASILAVSADAGADVVRIADRRAALAARADGVRREIPVVGAFALDGPSGVAAAAAELASIEPDQVWVAVDASRKTDDTDLWVRAVDAILAVDAVAATGAAATLTPHSVHALGLPVLWLDAPPA